MKVPLPRPRPRAVLTRNPRVRVSAVQHCLHLSSVEAVRILGGRGEIWGIRGRAAGRGACSALRVAQGVAARVARGVKSSRSLAARVARFAWQATDGVAAGAGGGYPVIKRCAFESVETRFFGCSSGRPIRSVPAKQPTHHI